MAKKASQKSGKIKYQLITWGHSQSVCFIANRIDACTHMTLWALHWVGKSLT